MQAAAGCADFGEHFPEAQVYPVAQPLSSLQLVLQSAAPQTYSLQSFVACSGQVPLPSHVCALPLLHVPHAVAAPGNAHSVFTPSQVPPQVTPAPGHAGRIP